MEFDSGAASQPAKNRPVLPALNGSYIDCTLDSMPENDTNLFQRYCIISHTNCQRYGVFFILKFQEKGE